MRDDPAPPPDPAGLFAAADVFHAAAAAPYVAWGAMGMGLLRRLEALTAARLAPLGYEEIRLPALAPRRPLERYLGPGARRLLPVAAADGSGLVLAPFSDLHYLHHVQALIRRGRHLPHRAYAWSRCFLDEAHRGFLDFGEYGKCEIFSAHTGEEGAAAAWEKVNAALTALCREDLCLEPLTGTRPAITAFPFTRATFSVELGGGADAFQTLAVSHRMDAGFPAENGFPALAARHVNTACFSQKLLAALLLHHRDGHGFLHPPRLAPVRVAVIGADGPDGADRIRALPPGCDPCRALLDTGAPCAVVRDDGGWRLHRRHPFGAPPSRHPTLAAALDEAERWLALFERMLRERSRQRQRDALAAARAGKGTLHRVAPCCPRHACQSRVAAPPAALAKLAFTDGDGEPCAACGTATTGRLLTEREERYTSFYRERPVSPAGEAGA